MALVNLVLKVFDKVERKGKKGRVEIYVCGALVEMGVRKAIILFFNFFNFFLWGEGREMHHAP